MTNNSEISFNEYLYKITSLGTWNWENFPSWNASFFYLVSGLCSEAGEVAGKAKRIFRDEKGVLTKERKQAIIDELGDVLWYVAILSKTLGYDLETVALGNYYKLRDRKERGVIYGEGDDR